MSLLTDAQQIKNETTTGANTAVRVGTLLENIVQDYDSKSKEGQSGCTKNITRLPE